jgi:CubicO group peptidase (beta-lactamase class C family)
MPFKLIDTHMRQAVGSGIFPGGALIFSKAGKILFHEVYGCSNIFDKRPVTRNSLFDLASLTKPMATTLAVLSLVQQGKITLEQTLGSIIEQFKNTPKADIQIRHLLCHNSGLPSYQPYFMEISHALPREKTLMLQKLLVQEPLISAIGATTEYSDIGFMILKWVIETITDIPLDQYLDQEVYVPLEVTHLFYVKSGSHFATMEFVATEVCPWRGRLIQGEVHDENAFVMGGVAGHAGLFGTAESVHKLLSELMGGFNGEKRHLLFKSDLLRVFLTPPANAQRAIGFDVPSDVGSSCGHLFTNNQTVGHLGFTGVSFWMDLHRSIIIVLLTNRIHPTRDNEMIKTFRPVIHDVIMNAIISSFG